MRRLRRFLEAWPWSRIKSSPPRLIFKLISRLICLCSMMMTISLRNNSNNKNLNKKHQQKNLNKNPLLPLPYHNPTPPPSINPHNHQNPNTNSNPLTPSRLLTSTGKLSKPRTTWSCNQQPMAGRDRQRNHWTSRYQWPMGRAAYHHQQKRNHLTNRSR